MADFTARGLAGCSSARSVLCGASLMNEESACVCTFHLSLAPSEHEAGNSLLPQQTKHACAALVCSCESALVCLCESALVRLCESAL
eukprot:6093545-Pleurochrysis_carterae.AAC.1